MLRRVTILRIAAISSVAAALSLSPVFGAHAAAAKQPLRGLDVSAYQHTGKPINWERLASAGIRFAAVKVSEGTYYVNRYYRQDVQAATKSGLAVMPYVFANPGRARGPATARYAVKAEGKQRGGLPLVVDLENNPYKKGHDCYSKTIPGMIAWISGFIKETKALTGHSPVIYTTAAWWRECTGPTSKFQRNPLWLAAFAGTPPTVPAPWEKWTFWQYDNNGTVPGIGPVDLDYFRPTATLPTLHPAPRRLAKKAVKGHAPKHAKTSHQKPKAKQPKHAKQSKHAKTAHRKPAKPKAASKR